jgi:hypothetical protein
VSQAHSLQTGTSVLQSAFAAPVCDPLPNRLQVVLLEPRVLHPYPECRFAMRYLRLRQEPYALMSARTDLCGWMLSNWHPCRAWLVPAWPSRYPYYGTSGTGHARLPMMKCRYDATRNCLFRLDRSPLLAQGASAVLGGMAGSPESASGARARIRRVGGVTVLHSQLDTTLPLTPRTKL